VVRRSTGTEFCWSDSTGLKISVVNSGMAYLVNTFAINWEEAKLFSSLNAQLSSTVVPVVCLVSSDRSLWILRDFSIIRSAKASIRLKS